MSAFVILRDVVKLMTMRDEIGKTEYSTQHSALSRFQTAGRVLLTAYCLLLAAFCLLLSPPTRAQEVVDKIVATINGRELITYSDLLWQLALQPNTPLDNPRTEDLNSALERLIDQRLIVQEAGKLPSIAPKDADVKAAVAALIRNFPSQTAFYERAARVGLNAEQVEEIVRQRVEIENYLDFRFRSFTVVTDQEIADYYRDVYVPRKRRESPGRIIPTLKEAHDEIETSLKESKIASETDAFLEDARTHAEIIIFK